MIQDAEPASHPASRNGAARKSLVASIVFLVATVIIIISNGVAISSWGRDFFKANPEHPLAYLMGCVFELTFLCLPFNFLVSLIVILAGIRGLSFAGRSGDGAGRGEAIGGIGLSLLAMLLSVAGFLQWGSGFVQ